MVAWRWGQEGRRPCSFKLNGAGATFPAPLYNSWFQSFAKETGNQVNYQAVGSGSGVRQYVAKTVDFGASDGAVRMKKLPGDSRSYDWWCYRSCLQQSWL